MNTLIQENDVINLADGNTDFPASGELLKMASDYLRAEGSNHNPLEGVPEFRECISARIQKNYGHKYDPKTEITITTGVVQAVHTAISTVVRDDDEVIVFEPAFETFVPSIMLNGGKPVYVRLKSPDFRVDWEELRKMVTSKTRMIIINSPHHPTGSVFSADDMLQLQRLTNGTKIIILSVEDFESVIFDNIIHQSVARFEKLIDRSLVISSPGPLYSVDDWGIAYCVGSGKLMSEFRKVQRIQSHNSNAALQRALAGFLATNYPADDLSELYQGKRNYFNRLVSESLFQPLPAQGGYFQLLDYSQVSEEPDIVFAERLIKEYGVAVMPVSAFYHEKTKSCQVRVCFARTNEKLEQAAARLMEVKPVT